MTRLRRLLVVEAGVEERTPEGEVGCGPDVVPLGSASVVRMLA